MESTGSHDVVEAIFSTLPVVSKADMLLLFLFPESVCTGLYLVNRERETHRQPHAHESWRAEEREMEYHIN